VSDKADEDMPQFGHDCNGCTFLGRFSGYDLYHCEDAGPKYLPTVVARWSSYGPNYKSGIQGAEHDPELREAVRRAKERGLRCE
jgi:hypothetical protein